MVCDPGKLAALGMEGPVVRSPVLPATAMVHINGQGGAGDEDSVGRGR